MRENFSGLQEVGDFAGDFDNKLAELVRMWCEAGMKDPAERYVQHNSNLIAAIGMKLLAAGVRVITATGADRAQVLGIVASIYVGETVPKEQRAAAVAQAFDEMIKRERHAQRPE